MIFGNKDKTEFKELFNFDYTELTAIEEYLTLKEKEGFRLKEIKGERMVFESSEPGDMRYAAAIYKGAFDNDFISSCEQEGWELCGVYHKELYIFRTEKKYITDIMTDEQQKMKSISKRELLRSYSIFWLVLLFGRFLRYSGMGASSFSFGYNESGITYWLWWIVILFAAYRPFCNLANYLIWLLRAKIKLRQGEEVKYLGYSEAKIKDFIENSIYLLITLGGFAFIYIADSGYMTDSNGVYWFVAIFIAFAVDEFVSVFKTKITHGKAVKIISLILIIFVAIGTHLITEGAEKKAVEVSGELYSTENIPLSLSDFGYEEKLCKDKGNINATKFAQHYVFTSSYKEEITPENEQDYISEFMSYEVFISDYEQIRENFIDRLMRYYEKYDHEIQKLDDDETSWDICYRETDPTGENRYAGLAIKGNTIFLVDRLIETGEEDLFETAYEKLFAAE